MGMDRMGGWIGWVDGWKGGWVDMDDADRWMDGRSGGRWIGGWMVGG